MRKDKELEKYPQRTRRYSKQSQEKRNGNIREENGEGKGRERKSG